MSSVGDLLKRNKAEYLGDAVYVYKNQFSEVYLVTTDGIQISNRIVLDPVVLSAFLNWIERIRG